jgi:putative hydrolase of the HAD superfamily
MLKKQFELKEGEFLSVGNRIETDLKPAKICGGFTCWFRHGEHSEESTSSAEPRPDYIIHHHRELIVTCNL